MGLVAALRHYIIGLSLFNGRAVTSYPQEMTMGLWDFAG
jgi:hypothetical protein